MDKNDLGDLCAFAIGCTILGSTIVAVTAGIMWLDRYL